MVARSGEVREHKISPPIIVGGDGRGAVKWCCNSEQENKISSVKESSVKLRSLEKLAFASVR